MTLYRVHFHINKKQVQHETNESTKEMVFPGLILKNEIFGKISKALTYLQFWY